jgi:hypothetical protein
MTMSEASVNTTRVSSLTFPEPNMVLGERSVRALWTHSLIQAKRLLMRWMRDPSTMIQALLYPALMLVMFRVVLGNSISAATGAPAIYGQVPMIALVGAMFGSIVSAVGLKGERKSGLLSRFWTTPTHRAAGLLGGRCDAKPGNGWSGPDTGVADSCVVARNGRGVSDPGNSRIQEGIVGRLIEVAPVDPRPGTEVTS